MARRHGKDLTSAIGDWPVILPNDEDPIQHQPANIKVMRACSAFAGLGPRVLASISVNPSDVSLVSKMIWSIGSSLHEVYPQPSKRGTLEKLSEVRVFLKN
jgi:hypothetical protein